jgi:hypothetical protein
MFLNILNKSSEISLLNVQRFRDMRVCPSPDSMSNVMGHKVSYFCKTFKEQNAFISRPIHATKTTIMDPVQTSEDLEVLYNYSLLEK